MANPLPTASQWKSLMLKYQIKDNGLVSALGRCEKLGVAEPAEMLKALETVLKCVAGLMKDKGVTSEKAASSFLDAVRISAEKARKEVSAMTKR